MDDCLLIVGLGNPGRQYEQNRHNVGFMITEAFAEAYASSSFKKMVDIVEVTQVSAHGKKCLIARPLTFMNLSGRAVRFLIDFYKIPLNNVLVIHDDIDLPFGRVKIKRGGGNGGHNGLKNIDNLVGNDYWRVRIGVGRPEMKSMIVSYVLGNFSDEEKLTIERIADKITNDLPALFPNDIQKLTEELNTL
ncbi:MAG: aminoacyl-tRNA hydrolase [Alphaproteobacteria bacterium]|nr:aminoacyl-tRNA hydrolase [Alphaproteobacteria bacterium]